MRGSWFVIYLFVWVTVKISTVDFTVSFWYSGDRENYDRRLALDYLLVLCSNG